MCAWKPLKTHVGGTLVDGVPNYLVESLSDWIEDAEFALRVGWTHNVAAQNDRDAFMQRFDRQRRNRSGLTECTTRYFIMEHYSICPDDVLDYLDYVLAMLCELEEIDAPDPFSYEARITGSDPGRTITKQGKQHLLDTLDNYLKEVGSKWRVGQRGDYIGLVERVNPTVDEAADKAMSEAGDAGTLLAESWGQLFGRNPNPSEAYRTTVKAVEAATKPYLCPKDDQYTLGKGLRAMRDQHQGYVIDVLDDHPGNTPPHNVDGGVIQLMMRSIWESQHDRHAGNGDSTPITSKEARAAIFLAVPIIQAFHDGLVSKPK